MKKWMVLVVCGFFMLSVRGQDFRVEGFESQTIPVTGRKMTNVLFPAEIAAGIWVTRDVTVQRVKGVLNAIELKASRKDFAPTNFSVFAKDGRLYSFVLRYVEDTTVLNYRVLPVIDGRSLMLADLPVDVVTLSRDAEQLARGRGFLRVTGSSDGLRVRVTGVWTRDSLMWLTLRVYNKVAVGFVPDGIRVLVEDGKKVKRTATQEVEVPVVYASPVARVPEESSRRLAIGLAPLFVSGGKRLVIELRSADGDRVVSVRMKGRLLRKLRKR